MEIAHILLIVTSSQVQQLELGSQKFNMIQIKKSIMDSKVHVNQYLRKMKKHHLQITSYINFLDTSQNN